MARDDVTDFMSQHRRQLIIACQAQQSRRDIDMPARKREAVDLAALNDVKLVKHVGAQAGLRTALAGPLGPIETYIRQIKFLRDLAMKLHPEFDLITLTQ